MRIHKHIQSDGGTNMGSPSFRSCKSRVHSFQQRRLVHRFTDARHGATMKQNRYHLVVGMGRDEDNRYITILAEEFSL